MGISSSDLDLRAASSLSCDPARQTNPSQTGFATPGYSPSLQTSTSNTPRSPYFRRGNKVPQVTEDNSIQQHRRRPLSWLPFSRSRTQWHTTKSLSMPLPQHNSMSSVSRSTIGTPVLTSTTNARVAGIENVECSDVLLPDYSSKKVGSVQMSTNRDSSSPQPQHDTDKSNPWAVTVRSVKKTLSHTRRASTSLLLDGPLTRRNARGKGHAATPSVGSSRMLGSVTTYKDKLHHWTGRDPRPQVETRSDASLSQSLSRSKASTANVHSAGTGENEQRVPRLPCLYTESTTNLLATSLSRSFASAVEKIDFDSSPTLVPDSTPTSRLKKAKSLWSLNRLVQDVSGRSLETGELNLYTLVHIRTCIDIFGRSVFNTTEFCRS